MNSKPFEFFHQSLISQYRDQIHEAILESETEHKSHLDLVLLANKLHGIVYAAEVDGLSQLEIGDLLDEVKRFELRMLKAV